MALQIGSVQEYDENNEDFQLYIERLEEFVRANDIDDSKKVSVFLSVIGAKTYKLLRSLLQPNLPNSQTFDTLVKVLKDHFRPPPITIAERYRFHKRNQSQGETVAAYLVELKRLASTCDFGCFLDEAIRDRLVCGLNCEATQKRLLAKKGLTLAEASNIALAMEMAEKNTSDINLPAASIHVLSKQKPQQITKNKMNVKHMTNSQKKCFRCGGSHTADKCRYVEAKCYKCQKIGHIAPVCKGGKFQNKEYMARLVSESKEQEDGEKERESENQEDYDMFSLYSINYRRNKLPDYSMQVIVKGKHLNMILDTAADTSTIGETWLRRNCQDITITKSNIKLQDYNAKQVKVVGQVILPVTYEKQQKDVEFIVVEGDKPSLFGKDCIKMFNIDWHKIFLLENDDKLPCKDVNIEKLLQEFNSLFKYSQDPIKEFKATVGLENNAIPTFRKSRPVPCAIKPVVEAEIKKIQKQGVWKFVKHSRWATPIVVVPKRDGSVRICGDFKISINPYIRADQYPLPTQQDLFATLNGGVMFSKLDMRQAYQQVQLDEPSQEYLTLNTHIGLVRPTRLLYGITSAAAIFQSVMDKILQGLEGVLCYQDDILVMGRSEEEHTYNLRLVFQRLKEYGVKLNYEKCQFMQSKVTYLGHLVDREGIHPTDEKVQAIKCIKSPQNVNELRSFLGILNYYVKFIENASTLLHPLYTLLHKGRTWEWSKECERTFQKCKEILSSDSLLVHFDQKKKIKMSCDASPYGVGAILSHTMKNGEEKPVAYASRTLSKAEQGYSQVEREALAIVFGLKKFQQYLFGNSFIIVTDHKPLVMLFGPRTAVPAVAAARIQRWSLLLSSFKYEIEYKKGIDHQNVDTLSRFPMPEKEKQIDIFSVSCVNELPIRATDIKKATIADPTLSRLLNYIKYGWPDMVEEEFQPFFKRREQMSVDNDCVLWGMRVVIPNKQRNHILELLHDTHPGICRMKAIARSHVWWPGLDQEIEEVARSCQSCIQSQSMPPMSPMQPWSWPRSPWDRIHVDFGQKGKEFFLIVVDSHSKWIEVEHMHSITTERTIEKLRSMFARYGLPRELVSDNGPQLVSEDFERFLATNGVRHTLIPTYHPQSNGAAERAVQFFKSALDKMKHDINDISTLSHMIARFLLVQHSTPHSTTGKSPSEMFMGRVLRTNWSLIHNDVGSRVEEQQNKQKQSFDRAHSVIREFIPGMKVWVRNFRDNPKWVNGTLIQQKGSKTWTVRIKDKMRLVHVDQIRPSIMYNSSDNKKIYQYDIMLNDNVAETTEDSHHTMASEDFPDAEEIKEESKLGIVAESQKNVESGQNIITEAKQSKAVEDVVIPNKENDQSQRYPSRIRRKPVKLDL